MSGVKGGALTSGASVGAVTGSGVVTVGVVAGDCVGVVRDGGISEGTAGVCTRTRIRGRQPANKTEQQTQNLAYPDCCEESC